MTPKKIHKILIPPKKFIFLKTPKNIEIQNFEPQKMDRAYVCVKILEYPPPLPLGLVAALRIRIGRNNRKIKVKTKKEDVIVKIENRPRQVHISLTPRMHFRVWPTGIVE